MREPRRVRAGITALTLAAGVLSFGAVYPWGYWTLAVLCAGIGTSGLVASEPRLPAVSRPGLSPALGIALAATGLVIALQVMPIPEGALAALNPAAAPLLREYDPAYAIAGGAHALSIAPHHTATALLLYAAFATLLAGTVRALSFEGSRALVSRLAVVGTVLAIVGIVQKPLYSGRIYGFWTPVGGGNPFGPFVNRNHFAGCVLMLTPLALGLVLAQLARAMRDARPDSHHRLMWLSSRQASALILSATAVAVMALSIVLSLSRSGLLALGVALALGVWNALRHLHGGSRKAVAAAFIVALAIGLTTWVGTDVLARRFSGEDRHDLDGRLGAWTDAISTARRHWLTGTGVNSYQIANLFYQRHDTEAFVSSAHNDYLQVLAEGGLLLAVPVSLALVALVRDIRRRFTEDGSSSTYWLRAGAVTGLVAVGLQECVDFSLQVPANAALFAVLCAIALHRPPVRRTAEPA